MRTSGAHTEQHESRQATRGPAPARQETSGSPAVPPPLTADALRAAQRGAGNAAVTAMIARRARPAPAGEQPDPGVHDVLRSAGKPLAPPVRRDMESRFGSDFSDVRLHTGATAARSARAIGARAYTSGSHVVLGDGGGDKHTLAHELTHVVQQRQGPVAGTDHGTGLRISDPSDRFEQAAEQNARRMMSGPAPARREAEPAAHPAHSGHVAAVQRMQTDDATEEASGEAGPAVPAGGRLQPEDIPDAKRVGLEIEITVNLQEPSQGGQAGSSGDTDTPALKNGDLLAESAGKELGLPVIKLEIEGMDRTGGVPSIELIYGPLPRAEYGQNHHQRARQKLFEAFSRNIGKSVPFGTVITAYNQSLAGQERRYRLVMTATGSRLKTLRGRAVNQNIQTNISLPYSKVGKMGAAQPPAEAPANRGRGRGTGRGGPSRGAGPAGRGRGGAARPPAASPSRVRGDFAGLFQDESQKDMFERARRAANHIVHGIDEPEVHDHPNVISLFTQVLFQEAMYSAYRIEKGAEEDVDKQRFHVMLKVSPQDAVMTILTDEEAQGLHDWLADGAAEREALDYGIRVLGGARSLAGKNDFGFDFEDLKRALNTRLSAGRQRLEVRKKGTDNDHSSPVFDQQDAPAGELQHFHPRPSNRVPVTLANDVPHVVVEERSAGHLLNNPTGNAAEKNRFIEDLQDG